MKRKELESLFRREYLGQQCELDGERAVVKDCGSLAMVIVIKRRKVYHVLSWSEVARTFKFGGGKFKKKPAIFLKG